MAYRVQRLYQRWQTLPIRVRGTAIVAIPITCLFMALSAFAWLKASLVEDETWVQHTQTVRLETKQLLNALIDAETGVRGYGLTQREEFLDPYNHAQTIIPPSLNQLEKLVQDNVQQTQQIQKIRTLVNDNLEIFQQKLTLRQTDTLVPVASLYEWLEEGKLTMDQARQEIDRFAQTEEELLVQRIQHQDSYRQITWIVLCISVVFGTIAALFAVHLFYQLERELANREINLRETNQRLEIVCDQLQRFTANASHELRAPLAAIMSNAQVGLMDLDEDDSPMQLRKRIEKIISLTKQMSTLVGDLLFLARHEGLLAPDSMESVNLTELLESMSTEWLSQAKIHSLELTSQLPDTTVVVQGDANLLLTRYHRCSSR